MKKFLCLLLAMMLLIMSVVPTLALSDDSVRYYRKNFTSKYVKPYDAADGYYFYYEQYHHYVGDDIDWVLVYAGDMSYKAGKVKQVVGEMIFFADESSSPFVFKYAVYDVKKDEFYPISNALFDKYDGLYEAFHNEETGIGGYMIGDADMDKVLSVMDATLIQLSLVGLSDFNENDDLSAYKNIDGDLKYVSDYDRDGVRSVMDATGIQYYIVNNPTPEDPDMMM